MKNLIALFALITFAHQVTASDKIVAKIEVENKTSYQDFGRTLQVVLRANRVVEVAGQGFMTIDNSGQKPNFSFYIAEKVEEKKYADLPQIAELLKEAKLEIIKREKVCKKMAPSFQTGLLLMPSADGFKPVYSTDECWRDQLVRPEQIEILANDMVEQLTEIAEDLVYEFEARKK